ncbi:MAG: orotidine-5'-phosphate decarboxylase [Candidatus Taylorbacteria bacterium]|nr:orotidine-5'-phosphate decarboxylase [Candidatus Taylorbacteria bacterium]
MTTENKSRIIVALDDMDGAAAFHLARQVEGEVWGVKIGLELFIAEGASLVIDFTNRLRLNVFLDLKLHDIPNTVARAVSRAAALRASLINLHCSGGLQMMRAAKVALEALHISEAFPGTPPRLLGVTVLTSLKEEDLEWVGLGGGLAGGIAMTVKKMAEAAKAAGLDGVVCSPQEIALVRGACGGNFLIVTPGCRPEWADVNDQKRVMKPEEAVALGADYIVIGRPITKPPEKIGAPLDAVRAINSAIESALKERNDR